MCQHHWRLLLRLLVWVRTYRREQYQLSRYLTTLFDAIMLKHTIPGCQSPPYYHTPTHQYIMIGLLVIGFADFNECELTLDDCEQICTDEPGGFMCYCYDGYTLDADGVNCLVNGKVTMLCVANSCTPIYVLVSVIGINY